MPNLVKYCVDCFCLLFICSYRVGYIFGCICLYLVDSSSVVAPRATINLSNNEFEGFLPYPLGNLSMKLEKIIISVNKIRGSIPAGIGNLIGLVVLYLDANKLTGAMPSVLGRLERLQILSLGSNSLSDHIPSEFGQLRNLIQVNMSQITDSPNPYQIHWGN